MAGWFWLKASQNVVIKTLPRQEAFLVDQWLRLCAPTAAGLGSIPGQGTGSHMPGNKIPHAAMKVKNLCVTIKMWRGQIIAKDIKNSSIARAEVH